MKSQILSKCTPRSQILKPITIITLSQNVYLLANKLMLNDLKPAGTATNLLLSINIIKLFPIKSFMSIAIPKFL